MNIINKILEDRVWTPAIVFTAVGFAMLYIFFFTKTPSEKKLFPIYGKIKSTYSQSRIKGGALKIIRLQDFYNSFEEGYLSVKDFNNKINEEDSVYFQIRTKDLSKLNNGSSIKIWSLKINDKTIYDSKFEINRQENGRKYFAPAFAIVSFLLAILFIYPEFKKIKS
jgi:hypothetical protein